MSFFTIKTDKFLTMKTIGESTFFITDLSRETTKINKSFEWIDLITWHCRVETNCSVLISNNCWQETFRGKVPTPLDGTSYTLRHCGQIIVSLPAHSSCKQFVQYVWPHGSRPNWIERQKRNDWLISVTNRLTRLIESIEA